MTKKTKIINGKLEVPNEPIIPFIEMSREKYIPPPITDKAMK